MSYQLADKSRSVTVEFLETRQLLAAAVSTTELLAQLNNSTGLRTIDAFLTSHPAAGLHQYLDLSKSKQLFRTSKDSTIQLALKKGVSVNNAIKLLQKLDAVKWASPNFQYGAAKTELTPNDPRFAQQTAHLNLINAPQAWDTTLGAGVTVAVLDDGVDIDHEDLAANIWTNSGEIAGNGIDDDANGFIDDISGWDFGSGDNNPRPVLDQNYNFINSHGTLVASIMGGVINNNLGVAGVAGAVKIMPVRFTGYGVVVSSAGIAQSLAYAANNGAKVINVSFSIDPYMNDPAFAAATDLAYSKGCLWLNSAGNSNVENPPRFAIEKALFLANTSLDDVRYVDSNYGSGVDLAAPGVDLWGAIPGNAYQRATGTSFSTAVTSGVAALIWAAHPTWSRDQVAAQLIGTTDNIDAANPTLVGKLGSGRVNAFSGTTGNLGSPKLRGLVGIANGATITTPTSALSLHLLNVLDASTVTSSNFELRFAGADGVFDVSDTTIPLSISNAYAIGTNLLKFTLPTELLNGNYRFTAKSAIIDPFGNALDGNGNGTGGDDYVVEFTVNAAPTPPTSLTAATPSYSQSEAELTWVDTSTNELNFILERSSTPDFATIDKTYTALANSTRYNDWGLSQGNTYYYRIRSNGVNGPSAPSNTATLAIPLPPPGIPNAPSNFTATTPSYSQTEVELKWTDNSNNETLFVIERSTVIDFASVDKTFNAVPGSNQYNDWGLTPGQIYYYRIKAMNGTDSSTWSPTATHITPGGVTPTVPNAPSTLTASVVSGSNTSALLGWVDESNNETGFVLERSTSSVFVAGTIVSTNLAANATSYTDIGLALGTTYYYRIRGVNAVGPSANSNTATFVTEAAPEAPSAPTTLTAGAVSGSTTSIAVAWVDTSSNETSFVLEGSTTSTFTAATTASVTLGANVTAYTATGLTAGVPYFFRVRAVNAVGPSADSNTATYTIPAPTAPAAPTTLAATFASATSATITWMDASSDETGFELQRSTTSTFTAGTFTTTSLAANLTTTTSTGLTAGATYYFRLRAVNAVGPSAYTPTLTYVAPSAPAAPNNLAVAVSPTLNTSANITWRDNSTNETGFEVQRSTTSTFTAATTTTFTAAANATTLANTGLALSTTYYFRVRAVNAVGNSAYSSTFTYNSPANTAPSAPSGLTATSGGASGSINLTWNDNSNNETGFQIIRSTNIFFIGTTTINVAANTTTFTNTGLNSGTTYYYRVRATNAVGNSSNSNTVSFRAP